MRTEHDGVTVADATTPAPRLLLPRWFEVGIVLVVAGLVSVTGAGLLLALLGRYGLVTTLLWGLLGTVLSALFALRGLRPREGRAANAPAVTAVVIAVLSAAYNGLRAGHYVFVDRDPGLYVVAARWLSRTGTLQVNGGTPWEHVGDSTQFTSAGMYPEAGGVLEFQFNHLLAVLLAVAHGLGGDRVMFAANAVVGALGLLMVYAVGTRICRRPWLVVAAVAALGLSLPQLLFSRDTYSEPLTQLLLWGGMWLLLTAWERRRLGPALLAGLALGATVMARIDALLYLSALPVAAAVVVVAVRRGAERRFALAWAAAVLIGVLPTAVLGSLDVQIRATGYYNDLAGNVRGLRLLLVASFVAAALILLVGTLAPRLASGPADRFGAWWSRSRVKVAYGAGAVVTVLLVVAWALRPALQHPTGVPNSTTGALQAIEGLKVAPSRTYAEDSMTWVSWYLGPVTLALGVVGVGLLLAAALRGRTPAAVLIAVIGPASAVYLYQVSNTPDQVWAVRRYLPNVFPLLLIAAVVAAEALIRVVGPRLRRQWAGRAVGAAAAVGLVVFPLGVLLPVARFETQSGYLPAIDTTCDRIGPDAAVVFVSNDIDALVLPQTLRSFCDVPVTSFSVVPTGDQLEAVDAAARAVGRTLWVMGSSEAAVAKSVGTAATPQQLADVTNDHELEATLTRVPSGYESQRLSIWGAPVPAP